MSECPQKQVLSQDANDTAIEIATVSGRRLLSLKSWAQPTDRTNFVAVAGQMLPPQVGSTLAGARRILCVGPRDWLIVSQPNTTPIAIDPISLSEQGLVAVDLTDALAILELRGRRVRQILSKGCGMDLEPRSFSAGSSACTRFAQIAVILDCLDASPRFDVYVARSYLQYLKSWIADAAVEFADGAT